jgi:hypothetical protein
VHKLLQIEKGGFLPVLPAIPETIQPQIFDSFSLNSCSGDSPRAAEKMFRFLDLSYNRVTARELIADTVIIPPAKAFITHEFSTPPTGIPVAEHLSHNEN